MTSLGLIAIAIQLHECVPTLPLSARQLLLLAVIPPATSALSLWVLAALWTFPVPLGIMLIEPWLILPATLCSWWLWKETLYRDPETKIRVFRFLKVILVQFSLVGAYVAYYAIFSAVKTEYRSYLSALLPIMKLSFRNMARSGLFFAEDLAPVVIVINIDVFHMTFVCRTMQQTSGVASVLFIMAVDVVQSVVAFYEVYEIVRHVNAFANASQATEGYQRSIAAASNENPSLQPTLKLKLDIINFALYVVDTDPRVRGHPAFALPSLHRNQQSGPTSVRTAWEDGPTTESTAGKVVPFETHSAGRVLVQPQERHCATSSTPELSQIEQTQLKCVASVLKRLHMTEFYILIEFVEAALASIFTLYVLAISHMPNRVYYSQLGGQSDDDLHQMVQQLALYATLELISFVALCVALNRHLQHFSTIQQLAFVLQKHWVITVPTAAFWIFMNVQLTLQHFGMDFLFDFK